MNPDTYVLLRCVFPERVVKKIRTRVNRIRLLEWIEYIGTTLIRDTFVHFEHLRSVVPIYIHYATPLWSENTTTQAQGRAIRYIQEPMPITPRLRRATPAEFGIRRPNEDWRHKKQ